MCFTYSNFQNLGLSVIKNINKWWDFTQEDFEVYDKWLKDSDYAKKIYEINWNKSNFALRKT